MEKEREKLILTKEEAQEILFDDHEDFEIIEDVIENTSRWSENHRIVVKRVSDGKFFEDFYSCGATEIQDESPYEYSEPNFTEVFPTIVEVTQYL